MEGIVPKVATERPQIIEDKEWFQSLVEDCNAIIIERRYRENEEIYTSKWEVGERIINDDKYKKIEGGRGKKSIIKIIASQLKQGQRDTYYCVQWYEKEQEKQNTDKPKLCNALHSYEKNVSWRKIIADLPETEINEEDKIEIPENIVPIIERGDFRQLMNTLPDNSVDLILTDPPYPKEYLSLWKDLAKQAARVLKPGKFLIAYSGQSYLPEIFKMMTKYLEYYWLGGLYHKGPTKQIFGVNMWNRFKPILFFYKEPKEKQKEWFEDMIVSEQSDKRFHEWGQSVQPFINLIELFTRPGDIVCDPMMGGGVVIEACMKAKRNIYAFEKDKNNYDLVQRRMGNEE